MIKPKLISLFGPAASGRTFYVYYHKKLWALYSFLWFGMMSVISLKIYKDVVLMQFWSDVICVTAFSVVYCLGIYILYLLVKPLFVNKPVFIINHLGIVDYKGRFVAWHEVKEITQFIHDKNKYLVIYLYKPECYFGKYRSCFGYRPIVLGSMMMYFDERNILDI